MSLIALGVFGFLNFRRFLKLEEPCLAIAGGLTLGIFSALFVINLARRCGLGPESSLGFTALLLALVTAVAFFSVKNVPVEEGGSSLDAVKPWEKALVILFAALVWVSTNASQMGLPDQDYWLHAPLQRFMLDGQFPPRNPYFQDLLLHGHYARDLLNVVVAQIAGWDTIRAQILVTSFCQSMCVFVFYFGARYFTGSRIQAGTGILFLFLGVNAGYRAGWIDEFVSHSPAVHLHWCLITVLTCAWFQKSTPARAVWLALSLGMHSLVFTTTFATSLVALVLLGIVLRVGRARFVQLLLISTVALIIASVQGGALSHFFHRVLAGEEFQSQGIENQIQSVEIHFPKKYFLGITKQESDRSKSCIYSQFPARELFALIDHAPARYDALYLPIWSWGFLSLHWLALYLAPLSLFYLYRQKHTLGLFCWLVGLISYLTPGLFYFGAVHENDWYRWLIWTGSGFSAALALSLAGLAGSTRGARRFAVWPLFLVLFWLNTLCGLRYICFDAPRNIRLQGGFFKVAMVGQSTDEWLAGQGSFFSLDPNDLMAFQYLRAHGHKGQTVLVNFDPAQSWGIQFESTLAAYTGMFPLGHDLPQDEDAIGLPPTRMNPLSQRLLSQPSDEALASVAPDWIYLKSDETSLAESLASLSALERVFQARGADGKYRTLLERR